MDYKQEYEHWLNDQAVDGDTRAELLALADNDAEIRERFYKNLEFGTGGLRGILGAGSNRMNIYTVRKATQGLANYIKKQGADAIAKGVVIAHDCRVMSREFCVDSALVLCGNGIKAYIFDSLRPTPELSFAVRHLGCTAGIVITASHNPPEYNGYKAYWADGGQAPYPRDEEIIAEVNAITDFSQISLTNQEEATAAGLFITCGAEVDDAFVANVKSQSIHPDVLAASPLTVVYTPLHGAGNIPVRRVLSEMGLKNVFVVPEQAKPDGNFSTVAYPNPEDIKAFDYAIKLAEQKNADLVIATDPDADRAGVVVKHGDGYRSLTGNHTGVLLCEYILSQKKVLGTLPDNGAVVSTIVSTNLTRAIAAAYGMDYFNVLTGFKYIGEKIKEFEQSGSNEYVFGFEESYGASSGTYCRDKDAIVVAMLVCEAAAWYALQGKTLIDALEDIYQTYGYYKEGVESITLKGLAGVEDMKRIMAALRENPPASVAGAQVVEARDYKNKTIKNLSDGAVSQTTLPVSDVLYYALDDESWFCVRPSGTEPKIKLYFGVRSDSAGSADKRLKEIVDVVKGIIA
jgi:phosphoglucomutase